MPGNHNPCKSACRKQGAQQQQRLSSETEWSEWEKGFEWCMMGTVDVKTLVLWWIAGCRQPWLQNDDGCSRCYCCSAILILWVTQTCVATNHCILVNPPGLCSVELCLTDACKSNSFSGGNCCLLLRGCAVPQACSQTFLAPCEGLRGPRYLLLQGTAS